MHSKTTTNTFVIMGRETKSKVKKDFQLLFLHDKLLLFFITAFQVFSHTKLGLTSIDVPSHNQVPTSHTEEFQKELEVLIEILHYVKKCEELSNP